MADRSDRGPLEPRVRILLGRTVAKHRRQAGLTGHELGAAVGMSQSKISRLESGRANVTPREIGKLASALGIPESELRRVLDEPTDRDRNSHQDPAPGLVSQQDRIAQIESSMTAMREFSPNFVVGLLQTSEYARAVVASVRALLHENADPEDETVLQLVATRMARQRILADDGKRFHFIMAEAVLSNRICPPAQMLAQLQRIGEVSARHANVTIALVPLAVPWPFSSPNFMVYDDSHILVDLPNFVLSGGLDVALYRRLFEIIEKSATTDINPILDKYIDMYYDLARPRRD
ncbi:helix-turn-helix domain-containing protein [Virgisporangium aurantiacum]|uniref:Transcriptional regulator n=1 Tax=Virgisporangium aurantiacum TaxID=175570 RepID=A0A8J3YZS0_9ACTN|nr:helix-turn-helix transcriptional regulator [Virgisporangium aurantiacum]GIJ54659.1 transcriptional regulator [Virgisporangium aurantiacum]